MKRIQRPICLLLSLLLLLCLLPGASAASLPDGTQVIYTVVNDTLLELTSGTMPIVRDGILYVPYTVFSQHFDIRSSYNGNYLILQNDETKIIFNMNTGLAYDRDMKYIYEKAITVHNRAYVPVRFVASYFGMTYVWVDRGPIVRVKNNVAAYDDNFLPDLFKADMTSMLEALSNTGTTTDPGTALPEPKIIYLTFSGVPSDPATDILDILEEKDALASFFLTGTQLLEYEAVVRRIVVEGHSVGLTEDAESKAAFYKSADAMLETFAHTNTLLRSITQRTTRLVRLPSGSSTPEFTPAFRDALKAAGYRYWDWNAAGGDTAEGATAKKVVSNVKKAIESTASPVVISLHATPVTVQALPQILDYIQNNKHNLRLIRETDTPVNGHGDTW